MYVKLSSENLRPFCIGLDVLKLLAHVPGTNELKKNVSCYKELLDCTALFCNVMEDWGSSGLSIAICRVITDGFEWVSVDHDVCLNYWNDDTFLFFFFFFFFFFLGGGGQAPPSNMLHLKTVQVNYRDPWWRCQMETFSALLALCAGNSPVIGEFPTQSPVTRSFDVFFDLHLNKQLSKQSWGWWSETPSCSLWRHCNEFNPYPPCTLLMTWRRN